MQPKLQRGQQMSLDAFDALIARQSPLDDAARVAVIIASDFRFAYFGTAAFPVRLLRSSGMACR
jgi:hypothetical protein